MAHLKTSILTSAIVKCSKIIDDLKQRVESVTAGSEFNSSGYVHVTPPRIETIEEVGLLKTQLQHLVTEFEVLRKMESFISRIHTFVEFGTVVITNRGVYFVAPGPEYFQAEGRTIAGVSVQSQLYACMKGKREGDSFLYQGLAYHVKEIL